MGIQDCAPLVRAIQERVKDWQGRVLFFMGRITLIRSVLISFPVYMPLMLLYKFVILKMEQIIRTFLQNFASSRWGIHLLGWQVPGGISACSEWRPWYSLSCTQEGGLVEETCSQILTLPRQYVDLHDKGQIWSSFTFHVRGFRPVQHCSAIWREMVTRTLDILHHMTWVVGDGRSISSMFYPQISDVPLARWSTFSPWIFRTPYLSWIFSHGIILSTILRQLLRFLGIALVRGFYLLCCMFILVRMLGFRGTQLFLEPRCLT